MAAANEATWRGDEPRGDRIASGATLLVVDDIPQQQVVVATLFRNAGYRVRVASSGKGALSLLQQPPLPDAILLDVTMPEMDGFEVLERLRADPRTDDIPVVFVTSRSDATDEERGLRLGAADYIITPIRPLAALARVRAQIEAKRARELLRDKTAFLEAEVARRMSENELVQAISLRALAELAATRDLETGSHLRRTQRYVELLAMRLRDHPRFRETLTDSYVERLVRSAPLHDIGKVGIPDTILQKAGPLTPDEAAVMRNHARLGAEAIEKAESEFPEATGFLSVAKEMARWHHERWDGRGYPDGLQGEAIPLSARLMALADVFDALLSARSYKSQVGIDAVRDMIASDRGGQFDADVADALLGDFDAFVTVARTYSDGGDLGSARARTDLGEA